MASASKQTRQRTGARVRPAGRGWRLIDSELDGVLLGTVIALLVIGILMMFSASYPAAIEDGLSGTYYATRQLAFAGMGLALMFILSIVPYHFYEKLWVSGSAFGVAIIMLILVLIPGIGSKQGTFARRWIAIGGDGGLTFQPSELMKIAIVLFFATLIVRNEHRMKTFLYGIVPYMLMLGAVAGLMMLEPHVSGTLIIGVIALTLIFVGGARPTHFAVLIGIGVVGLSCVVLYMMKKRGLDYFAVRFQSYVDPFNPDLMLSDTWQTCQSLIAIGSGGMFGLGLGASRQKYQYLPEAQNDYVFAILCEEFGFVGAVTVILLFCLLIFRGFYIAAKAKDKFGMLVAVGFTMHIGLQALLNIAVVSKAIPPTGISLPFFSYGGTALMMQLAEMGVLLNISRHAKLN
ncbi:MAG: cell division protein FtsW [Oscillospiraceae bacterium]|jgi:cell division protein FtsW|nr:cell division protein FtsW [Oscillospiraceae bacterium]MBQ9906699.1 cell division protein FtsW [Oscillospiraceae bacterium]